MTTKITQTNISNIANRFIQWQSVQTSGFTAVAGRGYFCNTTSSAFTVTLPATAVIGDTIAIKDYAGTFATNNLTIGRNGNNIQGAAGNSIISTNRASLILVYVDGTRGWEFTVESNVAVLTPLFTTATGGTITTSGNFKIHSFTGDGCFVVTQLGNSPTAPAGGPLSLDYLVVAGGGAGGYYYGGGGGAGGYRTSFPLGPTALTATASTYPVSVGAGANGSTPGSPNTGTSGSNSIFSTITSAGGGGGGGGSSPSPARPGGSGGSGGGGGSQAGGTGGTGNTPPVSPPQGNNGGTANPATSSGGGGVGGAGTPSPTYTATPGGVGLANSISGSPIFYAGGGAGNFAGGIGGNGGGGNSPGGSATANTGGGGGGDGGNGGKGIVIIRYQYQ